MNSNAKKLVYAVDDEPLLLQLIRDVLEPVGYEVVPLLDGESLLREVTRRRPDLVLLDITMPGLSGWAVRARLEACPETSDIPVIAVTAFSGPGIEASSMAALGFRDYLRKPFRLDDLRAKVGSVLGRAEA